MITGQDLRKAREARHVGLGRLAARIGRDKGHLSRVERGVEDRAVTPALVRDYERALGVLIAPSANASGSPHAISRGESGSHAAGVKAQLDASAKGGALDNLPRDQSEAGGDESGSVRRRDFLAVGGAVVGAVLPASTRVSQALNVVATNSANDAGVASDSFDELIDHYSQAVCRLHPVEVYDGLLSVRSYAALLLAQTGSARRRLDLVVAAGWLSNLLAVTTSYMGDHAAALVWCSEAERRGREAGHPELAAWATLHRATISYYQGRAPRSATLARRGRELARLGTVPYAKLAAQEMRARAMLGDADGMAQAKRLAAEAIRRLPSGVPTRGAFSIALAEDPPYTATSLLLTKQFAEAISATNRVIEAVYQPTAGIGPERPSNYARSLLILALAQAGLGRVNEAVDAGQAALDSAGLVWPTLVLAGRLDQVLAQDFANVPATADYRARYRDAARTVGGPQRPVSLRKDRE